jgi:biotin synthase
MTNSSDAGDLRHDWSLDEIIGLFERPFNDLLFSAHKVHRRNFDPNQVQASALLNIKTGGCSEDCGYCSQSSHHETGLEREKMMSEDDVLAAARKAKDEGASRFCMGAAWRALGGKANQDHILRLIEGVRSLGLETCVTLGQLTPEQAVRLKEAGLDYYNHNVDTSEDYYEKVVTTHTYADRLDTIGTVQKAGIKVCSGGIIGMGENRKDRAGMLLTLANLPRHPDSVPINLLVPIPGTPFENEGKLDPFEFVRTTAVARILMERSMVRLSAGRKDMDEGLQALCFFAGANSIFLGDRLLTTDNADESDDRNLLNRLGIALSDPEHEKA